MRKQICDRVLCSVQDTNILHLVEFRILTERGWVWQLTYMTYRIVMCMPKEDVVELLRTLRFKAFKHNMINLQTIHRWYLPNPFY